MTNIPATAIIFTHIADTRFERALRSVQQFAEVLVFDNGSKNTWHLLEKKYTFTRSNLGSTRIKNFAAARNNALQKATYEWVFFLDSDEELLPNNPKLLRDLLTTNNNRAYTVTRSDFFLGKTLQYGESGSQSITRLVRKDSAVFTGTVHEVAKVTGSVQSSPLHILHHSHLSISDFIEDVSFYAQIVAKNKKGPQYLLLLQLLLFPPLKWFYTFFIRLGFLDGYRGLVYSLTMSLHSLLVRIYWYEKTH